MRVASAPNPISREFYLMKDFTKSIKNFLQEEDGPTAVEYAVMMALIIVVCMGTVAAVGNQAKAKFSEVETQLKGTSTN